MRLPGTRRARGIAFLLFAVLLLVLFREAQLHVARLRSRLGPELIARAETALQREVRVDRIDVEQPGLVVLEGLRVARGKTFADGVLLTATRVRLEYDPGLLHWSSIFTGQLSGPSRARLTARGVRLVQPVPLHPTEVLVAETLSTSFDIRTLLARSREVLGTVDRVDLGRPRIRLARAADGQWSVEPLLRLSRGRKRSAFRGVIHGTGAAIDFSDYRSGLLAAPARNRATGEVTLNFASAPAVHFSSHARVAGAEGGPLRLTGSYDGGQGEWRAFVEAHTGGLPYWYRYFARSERELKLLRGEARFSGVFWSRRAQRAPVDFRLNLDVKNGAAQLSPLREAFTAFTGKVQFTPGVVWVDGALESAGMPLTVRGQSVLTGERKSSYRLNSEAVSLAALRRLHPALAPPDKLSITGPVRSAVTLTVEDGRWLLRGAASSPGARYRDATLAGVRMSFDASWQGGRLERASGTLRSARGRYQSHPFGDLNLRFAARDELVNVSATAQAWGGGVDARGWLDLNREPADFYLVGRAVDVNGAELTRGREKLRLEGMLSAQFVASGTTSAPLVTAYVEGGPLLLNGNRVDSFSGRVRYSDEIFHVPYGVVAYNGQDAAFSGSVGAKGDLDLTFSARGVDVRRVLGQSATAEVAGTAYIHGRVTGGSEQPRVEGAIQVYRPAYGKQHADYLAARFEASTSRDVQLFDLNLIRTPDRATARKVTLTRGAAPDAAWELAGRFEVEGLTLVRALRLAGVEAARLRETPVAGDFEHVWVDVEGPVAAPSIRFQAAVGDAQVAGVDVGRIEAAGRIDAASRRLDFTALTATLAGGTLRMSGSVRQSPETAEVTAPQQAVLDLEYSLVGARVEPLIRRFAPQLARYAEVSAGRIGAQGRIAGSSSQPDLSASVELAEVVVNDRAIEIRPFRALWSPGVVVLEGLRAQVRAGSVDVERLVALIDVESGKLPAVERLAGVVQLREVPIEALRQFFEESAYFESKEAADIREALRQWRSPVAGTVTGTLSVPDGQPEGRRPATAREAASAMQGRRAAPLLTAIVSIPNLVSPPGPDETPTRVRADITYGARRLVIREFTLDQEHGAHVLVRGFRDDPAGMSGGDMSVHVEARDIGLHSLARIPLADVKERLAGFQPLGGILKLDADVSGRVRRPEIAFSLSVKDPTLMGVPFDTLEIERSTYSSSRSLLTLKHARLTKQLRAPDADGSSGEGTLTAAGTLPLAWPELRLVPGAERDFSIHLPDQPLSVFSVLAADAERLAGADESPAAGRIRPIVGVFREIAATGGRMRGALRLLGTEESPADRGDLYVTGGTLRVDGFETRIMDFNAHAALAGRELRLVECSGKSALGGILRASGSVDLRSRAAGSPPAEVKLELALDAFRFDEKSLGALAGEGLAGSRARGTLQTVAADSPQQPAPLIIRGVWPRPTIVGGVRVDDSTLSLALQPAVREAGDPFPGDVQLNVRLFAGREVWLRNAQVRLKLDGQLHATSSLNEPFIEGTLQASRGTFTLPTLRLRNAAGRIRVHYDARGRSLGLAALPPVYVDLSASTSIRLQRSAAVEAEYYDVTFQIRGSPGGGGESGLRPAGFGGGVAVGPEGGLQLAVRADPPLPRGEIEALIRQQFGVEGFTGTGVNVEEALRGQIEQAFAVNVTSILTTPIEQAIQSRLGLDVFSIELGVSQPLRVRLGKRLFGRLYGMLSQQWSSVEGQQRRLELYYRLSPNLRVGYRQEEPIRDRVIFFSGTASF